MKSADRSAHLPASNAQSRRAFRASSLAICSSLISMSAVAGNVNTVPAVAKASGGQASLAVGFDESGKLRARVCAANPCSLEGASPIATPREIAALASGARLEVVRLGLDRTAIVVDIPDPANGRAWMAIVVAPLKGGTAPLIPFRGFTGLDEGVEGDRSGPTVVVRNEGVYVGTEREGRDLCGRPAILAPEALDPSTLTLKSAKLQRLTEAERQHAPTIQARAIEPTKSTELLRARWATSAAQGAPPSALSDGDPTTAWAENRGGVGRGEFAVLSAPLAVPIASFTIDLPAPSPPHGAVPRELWLATDHDVFRVVIPEARVATRYEVLLAAPIRTACIALVLEKASTEDPAAVVSVSGLSATPAMHGTTEELVRALSSGSADSEAAGALLRAEGGAAFEAVATAYPNLDEGGRRVALDVLDAAPCDVALPVYIDALLGPYDAQRRHSRSALFRCESTAGPAFAHAMEKTTNAAARATLAQELADASPAIAVQTLLPKLGTATARERRAYRVAIRRAAGSANVRAPLEAALGDGKLDPRGTIDLMRALGDDLATYTKAAEAAFARITSKSPDFRTRFLSLGPAAALAGSDAEARAFLKHSLTSDPSPHVRARAASVIHDPRAFAFELSRALEDPDVRVREAAVLALGRGSVVSARDRVTYVFEHDSWPLVRVAAARALGGFPADDATDAALGERLENDDSAGVRRAIVVSIGARHATSQVKAVRLRFEDAEEAPGVRMAAASSLGALCDDASVRSLVKSARNATSPDDAARALSLYSLAALAAIHPPNLGKELAPLLAKGAPLAVQNLAARAVRGAGTCVRKARGR